MSIFLGNLSVRELETNHGFTLSEEDRQILESMRQSNAQIIEDGKLHIFDIPRCILCGSDDTLVKVYEILKKYNIKGSIALSSSNKSN